MRGANRGKKAVTFEGQHFPTFKDACRHYNVSQERQIARKMRAEGADPVDVLRSLIIERQARIAAGEIVDTAKGKLTQLASRYDQLIAARQA